jgi:hypothetical protein
MDCGAMQGYLGMASLECSARLSAPVCKQWQFSTSRFNVIMSAQIVQSNQIGTGRKHSLACGWFFIRQSSRFLLPVHFALALFESSLSSFLLFLSLKKRGPFSSHCVFLSNAAMPAAAFFYP